MMIPLRQETNFLILIRILVYSAITVVDPAHVGSTTATSLVTCLILFRGLYSPPRIPRGVLAESEDKIRTFFG